MAVTLLRNKLPKFALSEPVIHAINYVKHPTDCRAVDYHIRQFEYITRTTNVAEALMPQTMLAATSDDRRTRAATEARTTNKRICN